MYPATSGHSSRSASSVIIAASTRAAPPAGSTKDMGCPCDHESQCRTEQHSGIQGKPPSEMIHAATIEMGRIATVPFHRRHLSPRPERLADSAGEADASTESIARTGRASGR
jgi:hypothetical protein